MSGFSEFMQDGGPMMWPILVFGVVTAGAAGRFAWRPERGRLGFAAGMWATTLAQIVCATLGALAAVFRTMSDPAAVPDDKVTRTLFEGLKECTRPGLLGGEFLVLALLLVAIGLGRGASVAAE